MDFSSKLFFLISTIAVFAILSHPCNAAIPLPIHLLRPKTGCHGHRIDGISCVSWRFGVETNNIRSWKTVPVECENYVGNYMLGHLYREDSKAVTDQAIIFAQQVNVTSGKDVWIFDVDETVLSNLPYYAEHGFGAEPYNSTAFNEWVDKGEALQLPESYKLYQKLLSLDIKIVFLTGRPQAQRSVTRENLKKAGYRKWKKLILRERSEEGKPAVVYKSEKRKELEENGYRIVGNVGDQWSDLLGTNTGSRTFKLPDPMYYIN